MDGLRVVLAEKPSVAVDLARVVDPGARRGDGRLVGREYTWTWAVGHLAELAPPEHYVPELAGRWRLELLPVLPDRFALRPREGRSKQLEVVRELLGHADEVIVATDAGREGELIWEYIREVCAYGGPWRRLWLSETTAAAVRAGFAALLPGPAKADLGRAARARSIADWLVGMNATMALSARHGGLWSAGRVQTPTLALLCRREAEIRAFKPEAYHVVTARFRSGEAEYDGRWFSGTQERLPDAARARAIASRVEGRTGRIASVERKRTEETPPHLFNLTDLQRAANARHGLPAAVTLQAAQALYERHKAISYPRTDSRHVSAETYRTFPARLRAVGGELAPVAGLLLQRLRHPGKRVVDDGQVTDHHALLPTGHAPDPARLTAAERQVYDLVVRRLLAALLPPAVHADTEAVTEVEGETFRSRAREMLEPGWRQAEPASRSEGGDQERDGDQADGARRPGRAGKAAGGAPEAAEAAGDLAGLSAGAASTCRTAQAEARRTKPPARYSEATLLRAMEHAGRLVDDPALAAAMKERGLGTPATRAAIIETLIRRGYATRERRALLPTPRGERLVGLAPAELRGAETTGEWEQRLRRIERGQERADAFLEGISGLTLRVVTDVAAQRRAAAAPPSRASVGTCPRCGGAVVESSKAFGCANWRAESGGCRWVLWKRIAGKTLTVNQARELLERGETKRALRGFKSRAGRKFEARLRLERETGRVSFVFDAAARPSLGQSGATVAQPAAPGPERQGGRGAVGTPGLAAGRGLPRRGQRGAAPVQQADRGPDAQVRRRPDVRPVQREQQRHLRGPAPDPG